MSTSVTGFGRRNDVAAFARDWLQQTLWDRSGGICQICCAPMSVEDVSFDRIIPGSQGGKYEMDNLQAAHLTCNIRKGDGLGCRDKRPRGIMPCQICGDSFEGIYKISRYCPKCKSPYWDRERRRAARAHQASEGGE